MIKDSAEIGNLALEVGNLQLEIAQCSVVENVGKRPGGERAKMPGRYDFHRRAASLIPDPSESSLRSNSVTRPVRA